MKSSRFLDSITQNTSQDSASIYWSTSNSFMCMYSIVTHYIQRLLCEQSSQLGIELWFKYQIRHNITFYPPSLPQRTVVLMKLDYPNELFVGRTVYKYEDYFLWQHLNSLPSARVIFISVLKNVNCIMENTYFQTLAKDPAKLTCCLLQVKGVERHGKGEVFHIIICLL